MARYFSAPPAPRQVQADWSDDRYPLIPDIHVPDHRPIDTGLLDARGNPIMRAVNPLGFGRDDEW